ncbi:MAG TPA: hypothetical protein VFR94_02895 [Nitrososphaeraceae archaeon]|nr:hypothetical protein [Nitrososphaeraceae archaeon]
MKKVLVIASLSRCCINGMFSTSVYAVDGGDESDTNTEQEINIRMLEVVN